MSKKNPHDPLPSSEDELFLPEVELGDEGLVDLGELDLSVEGSSIPMAEMPEPPSGQSLTSWTEVIRRQRAAQDGADGEEPFAVDAPSDKDLLDRVGSNELPPESPSDAKQAGDTSEIPQAEIPVFTTGPISESEIDLGQSPAGLAAAGSDVRFDILFPPSDAGGAMPIPRANEPPLSGKDFQPLGAGSEDDEIPFATTPGAEMSGVDLGAAIAANDPGRSSILDMLLRESGSHSEASPSSAILDFGDPSETPVRPSKNTKGLTNRQPPVATQPGIDLSEDGVLEEPLEAFELTGPDSEFGSDDAVDIYAQGGAPASVTDSGTLEISEEAIEESQRNAENMDSSSVDMNTRPSYTGSDFSVEINDAGLDSDQINSESDINLELPPLEDEADGSQIVRNDQLESHEAAVAAEFAARKKRKRDDDTGPNEIVPLRADVPENKRRGYLLHGGVLGLLLGAGSVLAAYFGGALPNRNQESKPAPGGNPELVAQLRDQADAAQKQAAENKSNLDSLRQSLADAGLNADDPAKDVKALATARNLSDALVQQLTAEAKSSKDDLLAAEKLASDAKTAADLARKQLEEAEKLTAETKKTLTDATKAAETATAEAVAAKKAADTAKTETLAAQKALDVSKAETLAAKKTADEAIGAMAKSLKNAGLDPAKLDEGLKSLVTARETAEAKEKAAFDKLTALEKKEAESLKLLAATKKAAEDATKARDAIDVTLKEFANRLAKAKFVGEKADSVAMLKGLDEALKATANDNSKELRDQLVKSREIEAKLSAELTAAKVKETEAAKLAVTAQADAKKLRDSIEALETKYANDAAKLKTELATLAKDSGEARARSESAVAEATAAKATAQRLTAEATRLKALNERLASDLEAVRELAELIKAPATGTSNSAKPDPAKLAERLFGDGMRAYFTGRFSDAGDDFRKAIQFKPDDARYHYLLGLSLWMTDDTKGADLAFEKGRDLEREGRPTSRAVSRVLERIQGPARQAVNAYRP